MSPGPLVVNVAELLRRPGSQKHVALDLHIEGIANDVCGLVPDGVVSIDLELESLSDGIVALGRVRAPWQGPCSRCLADVTGVAEAEIRELFVEHPDPDGETYPIDQEQIDLAPLVVEALLLELPAAPLCRPDCAGLCPICGIDRNRGSCSCQPEVGDPRWAVLDALRFDQ